ncbi:isochorismatase family cysteine hydrolase [Ferrimonas gelatinilytica]|uniref:Cysteine hydrolase n=1 Tax=Ferrimonas gelatinilytica TaxID=1255257 RepID=A0ABP9RVY1_9GAMM
MKTAFIGLDYIVDIMHPSGKIARSAEHAREREIIPVANRLLAHAKAQGWLSILVKVGFSAGYQEQPKGSPMFGRAHEFGALRLDGPGCAFHPDLVVPDGTVELHKPRVSAFYGTILEPLLRANGVERVVLAGVSSVWALQSTARDAHDRDYQVVIVEDACAAANQEEHQASITMLETIAEVVSAKQLGA